MERAEAKKIIQDLREQINRHDTLYYVQAQPEISDQDYDNLKDLWERQLKAFNDSGKIQVTEAEKATLKKFDDEYQISALVKSLK